MVDTDHRRHVVTHGPHGVVRLVAMDGPIARIDRIELVGPHLAHRHVDGGFRPSRRLGHPAAIGAGDFEVVTVHVDRVVGHREVAHADADPVAHADDERIDARERAAVPGPEIEVQHGADLRREAAGIDVVGVDEEDEVAIDPVERGVVRMHHDEAHHAHRHLHHLIRVRVIHEGAGLLHLELVDEGLAGLDLRLIETTHPVHAVGQEDAVPVDSGVLGQTVGDEDADLVALDAFDRRAGRLAVIAPQPRDHAGRDLALDRFGDQVELLPAVAAAPGERPAVQRHDRVVGASVGRSERRLGRGARLDWCLRQGRRTGARDRGRTQDGAGRLQETASGGLHERATPEVLRLLKRWKA